MMIQSKMKQNTTDKEDIKKCLRETARFPRDVSGRLGTLQTRVYLNGGKAYLNLLLAIYQDPTSKSADSLIHQSANPTSGKTDFQ